MAPFRPASVRRMAGRPAESFVVLAVAALTVPLALATNALAALWGRLTRRTAP